MITNKRKYMKNSTGKLKIIKIINVLYCLILVILCSISCSFLLYGTFRHSNQYIKLSAYGFFAISGITPIYLMVNKVRGFIIFSIIFIILSVIIFIIILQL